MTLSSVTLKLPLTRLNAILVPAAIERKAQISKMAA